LLITRSDLLRRDRQTLQQVLESLAKYTLLMECEVAEEHAEGAFYSALPHTYLTS
jgi:hypothetical protein